MSLMDSSSSSSSRGYRDDDDRPEDYFKNIAYDAPRDVTSFTLDPGRRLWNVPDFIRWIDTSRLIRDPANPMMGDDFKKDKSGKSRYTPVSDMYLLLSPEDNRFGPKAMETKEKYDQRYFQVEFGLPLLFRVGGYILNEYGIRIMGNFVDSFGFHLLHYSPENDTADELEGSISADGTPLLPDEVHLRTPFVIVRKDDNSVPTFGQIRLHDRVKIYGYRTTDLADARDLEPFLKFMRTMIHDITRSPLFDGTLHKLQRILIRADDNMGGSKEIPKEYRAEFDILLEEYIRRAKEMSAELNNRFRIG